MVNWQQLIYATNGTSSQSSQQVAYSLSRLSDVHLDLLQQWPEVNEMTNVHPIRTLQHLADDDISESIARDEIAVNLVRYTDQQIAEILIRVCRFETILATVIR